MPNEIKALMPASAALTCTIANLSSGSGRAATLIDNGTTRYQKIHIFAKITTGTSPVVNRGIYLWLIKADKFSTPNVITDGAPTTDGAFTPLAAVMIGAVTTDATSNKTYLFESVILHPGVAWSVGISHDTNVNLHATAGNHGIWWYGENPEIQ